jgi:hypothetical protein
MGEKKEQEVGFHYAFQGHNLYNQKTSQYAPTFEIPVTPLWGTSM